MYWMHSFYGLYGFNLWVGCIHAMGCTHTFPLLQLSIACVGCTHSMDWMRAFHWLDAFIPLIDCMHSMCWVHSIPLVWLLPFHVLGASILCVGFIHPMHLVHSSICFMHSFHCGLTAFVPLVGCISLHWLSAFLFLDCIPSFICWMHPFHGLISSRTLHVFQHCVIVQAFAHYCEGVFMHQMARNTRFKKNRCGATKLSYALHCRAGVRFVLACLIT